MSREHSQVAKALLKQEDVKVNLRNRNGQSPLSKAMASHHISAQLLLKGDVLVFK
jgi:hypothetical protein